MSKRVLRIVVLGAAILFVFSGCTGGVQAPAVTPSPTSIPKSFAIVVKDTENPYMQRMHEGFLQACNETGAEAILCGPGVSSEMEQREIIYGLIEQRVDAIAIAANDKSTVADALRAAREAGIAVVSLDAAVAPEDRSLHIQQASEKMIGRVLIQAGAEIMGRQGQLAILSTTADMPNQQSWVQWMRYELETYPEKYNEMELVAVEFGFDQPEQSANVTLSLLARYPNLKLIIAPTVVGMRAAANEITRQSSAVKLTGLGLPSDMETYIMSGVCPWMYLWNPSELGYLAAYALDALASGRITGAEGDVMTAGKLGGRVVAASEDGGTELVLGNPKMFDSTNIMVWKDVF